MAVAMALHEAARAKINLALHVTGRRGDGYHLLDSVVVFTDLGDRLTASPDDELNLAIAGPMAAGLSVGDNLVMKAAAALRRRAAKPRLGARLVLEKHLPVASGIGGGSADAAAALRLLARLWKLDSGPDDLMALGAGLGADVPVCVFGRPARMGGIGEIIEPLEGLPDLALALVNPGPGLATSDVFARLERRHNAGLPGLPEQLCDARAVAAWLAHCRNDLEAAAIAVQPAIADVLAALAATPGCLIARMSGSGATCFGLFADMAAADAAARLVGAARPAWWAVSTLARGIS